MEGLIRKFLAGAIEESFPDFGGAKRHDATGYPFYVEKSNASNGNTVYLT